MPNWCSNKLIVRGRRADISEFMNLLDGVKGEHGFFDAIYPMPKNLKSPNDGWYNWSLSNWGTKWDVYNSQGEWDRLDWKDGRGVSLQFSTAWSPPLEAMQHLSEKLPKLKITISYSDPDMMMTGKETYGPHY